MPSDRMPVPALVRLPPPLMTPPNAVLLLLVKFRAAPPAMAMFPE